MTTKSGRGQTKYVEVPLRISGEPWAVITQIAEDTGVNPDVVASVLLSIGARNMGIFPPQPGKRSKDGRPQEKR